MICTKFSKRTLDLRASKESNSRTSSKRNNHRSLLPLCKDASNWGPFLPRPITLFPWRWYHHLPLAAARKTDSFLFCEFPPTVRTRALTSVVVDLWPAPSMLDQMLLRRCNNQMIYVEKQPLQTYLYEGHQFTRDGYRNELSHGGEHAS